MKKMPIFLAFLFLFTGLWGMSFQNLPKIFFVEDQTGLSSLYNVKTEKAMLGTALQELYRLSASFQLKNPEEEVLATAQSHFYCWGVVANIWSPFHEKLGWIEEQSFQWFTRPVCRIYDKNNHLVGVAQRNFWGNKLTIQHPENSEHIYAVIYRPWHRYSTNRWQVHLYDETPFQTNTIDPSILVLLATYDSHHNQEAKVIEYSQDDEYIFMNENGFIQLGLEVEIEPKIQFSGNVTSSQQEKIQQLFSELCLFSSQFPEKLCSNLEALQKDEEQVQLLLDSYTILEEDSSSRKDNQQLSYEEQIHIRVSSEIDRWIRTMEMGIALLKSSDIGYSQKESLYHLLNEFVTEITH